MGAEITILLRCDGWEIVVGNKSYTWDHNDNDMGTEAIAVLLTDLGYTVDIEEDC